MYGLVKAFARCLADKRAPGKIRHTLADLIGQRVFGIACGHPDGNDADHLADDPIHKLLLGRDPVSGAPLASQPTISRFENGARRTVLYRMGRELAACVRSRKTRVAAGRSAHPPRYPSTIAAVSPSIRSGASSYAAGAAMTFWPGGPRTLTRRDPSREPNGQTFWFGAEFDPDGAQVCSAGAVNRGRQERGAQVPRPASSSPARRGGRRRPGDGDLRAALYRTAVSAPPRLPPSPTCPTATGVSSTRAPKLTEDRFSDPRVAPHLFRVRALLML